MTKKEYIGAFLDGYFSDKEINYGFSYFNHILKAEKLANKKWKQYKNQKTHNI